ncbi:MAG: thiamine pyrophosphate-dependent enzyme, partial [Halobacteriaceae archaeon]
TTNQEPERFSGPPEPGPGNKQAIEKAAKFIADCEQPTLIVGDQIARTGKEAVSAAAQFAEASGAKVHGEILTSEVNFPANHPQWLSHLPPDEDIVNSLIDTDLVIYAGVSTHTTLTSRDIPLHSSEATVISIGVDPWELGKNFPSDIKISGNPGLILGDLADVLSNRISQTQINRRLSKISQRKSTLEDKFEAVPSTESKNPSKHDLVEALKSTAQTALIVDEGITSKYVMLNTWSMNPQQYLSNKGGGLGYGLPATLGAAIAEHQSQSPRDVIGFIGDGSFLYYPNALYTAARYGIDATVIIANNQNYRILKDNAEDIFEDEIENINLEGIDFEPAIDLSATAESFGVPGNQVQTVAEIENSISKSMNSDGTQLVDVHVHD